MTANIRTEITVPLTPSQIAVCFAQLAPAEQAEFWNILGLLASDWHETTAQHVSLEPQLSLKGRRVMQSLGHYSHWGLYPKRTKPVITERRKK